MEWKTKANSFLIQNNLFCATQLKSDNYAFGTVLGGVAICNAKGDILQEINHKTGLQNNTILSIFSDNSENLWLGLDNGIAYVEISSPVSLISDIANMGTGYTCQIFENYLYLGTNQGLFVKPFSSLSQNEGIFELVENTEGQVWSLNVFDNQLICCHDRGVFAISGKKSRQLWNKAGTWKFIPLKNHSNKLLGGCYDGLVMLKKGENGWLFDKKIKGFSESTRFISNSEDESIWVSHGEKGLFHIRLNNQLDSVIQNEFYTSTNGLPSNSRNIVFKLKNDIFVSTISGFYAFNSDKKKFEPSEKYNALFGITGRLKSFSIDVSNNIWYIAENESGVLRLNENSTYTKISDPFKRLNNQYVEEFEFIYPYNEENIFLGIQTGFAHYSSKFIKSYNQKFDSFITKIELPYLDSTIYFNQVQNAELKHKFPFRKNAFRFHFTSNFLENTENLQFSYFLENYSDDWSVWSTIPFKDFTNLDPEHYTLKLKAQNTYNTISEISSFSFTITPPWYRSYWAWISYLLLGFFIVLINFRIFKTRMQHAKNEEIKKLEEKRLHDEEQFERKRMMDEKELIFLRNEKLRQEMLHRDKELANQAMNIIQKNKSFQKLNEELLRIQNATDDGLVKTKMVLLRKRIEKEIDEEQQNQIFETYFDEVHSDFSERLKEKYPQLSPKDIRLCAYIRMDMSTKEISSLFNISYRGAEINRYRLRKKLDLSREVNLPTFLSNI